MEFWCKHGVRTDMFSCSKCRKADDLNHDFGIFTWRGDGRYDRKDAVKVLKTRTAANKACDKMNETPEAQALPGGGYVVRSVYRIGVEYKRGQ
jgi:hypothetical protein